MNRYAQLQRSALSDRGDPGLHSLVRGIPAELPPLGRNDAGARRVGRPFIDQSMVGPISAAHREDGPQTQASRRRQLAKQGNTVDFLLTAKRDMAAAQRFFDEAMAANGDPDKVAMDKSSANKAAIDASNARRDVSILVRQVKYLNNIVEQDHRAINRSAPPARCSPASNLYI